RRTAATAGALRRLLRAHERHALAARETLARVPGGRVAALGRAAGRERDDRSRRVLRLRGRERRGRRPHAAGARPFRPRRGRARLEARAGAGTVGEPADHGAVLRAPRGVFAGIYTGALGVAAAVGAGLAEVEGGEGAVRMAQDVFALPAPHTFDAF